MKTKKIDKLKLKVTFLKSDLEMLQDRLDTFLNKKKQQKKIAQQILAAILYISWIVFSISFFAIVFKILF